MVDTSHLERMGRELKCPICLSLLNSAVSLTCNHVFCNSCIEKSMKSVSNCPVCKVPYQRREVRCAPHMDNLVSIYKSMEVASGVNIFVTQTATSTKIPGCADGGNQNEGENISERHEVDVSCMKTQDTMNQRRSNGKKSTRSSKTNFPNSRSKSTRPAFPTKKRVQVTEYPPPETPTQHAKFDGTKNEGAMDRTQNSSVVLKDKLVLNDEGEPLFSPFFWLRDDDDVEKSSQQLDEDQVMYTPPEVPCFSDIKDSDDKASSKMPPEQGICLASHDADFFDSEMFEWTQRACSPELCSSPTKMQVEDTEECGGIHEECQPDTQGKGANGEPRTRKIESMILGVDGDKMEVNLSTLPSGITKIDTNESGTRKPNKRSMKTGERKHKKRAKKTLHTVAETAVSLQKASESDIQEIGHDNKGHSLNMKENAHTRNKKVGFDANAEEPMAEHFSTSDGMKSLIQGDETNVTDFLASLDQREVNGSGCSLKICYKGTTKARTQLGRDFARSKTQKMNTSKDNEAECQRNLLVSEPPIKSFPVEHKEVSYTVVKDRKNSSMGIINPKRDKNLKCMKKVKFSTKDISKNRLVDDTQGIHDKAATKEIQPLKQIRGISDVKNVNGSSKKEKAFPVSSGVVLHTCETISSKIQCAFCQSTEDSEASGAMVHYLNGKPVKEDCNGGKNIVHAHRNCAEWAPNVYFVDDNAINLEAELSRSRRIKCSCCGIKGAALGCFEKSCRKSFHVPCARLIQQCRWDNDNFVMLCPLHASSKLPQETSGPQLKQKKKSIPRRHFCEDQVLTDRDRITSLQWNLQKSSEKLILCCSALTNAERETVSEFEKLSGVPVLKNWDTSVTHVIASTDENGACKRTLKFLMGVLDGKWILNIEWIKACMKAKELVDEQPYEIGVDIHGIKDGPRLGRLRHLNKQAKLFSGYKFYFTKDFLPSYKRYLDDLIIAAGGTVLQRKPISGDLECQSFECSGSLTFIIYSLELPEKCDASKKDFILKHWRSDAEALAKSTGAIAASNSWVLNSIAACKLHNLAQ